MELEEGVPATQRSGSLEAAHQRVCLLWIYDPIKSERLFAWALGHLLAHFPIILDCFLFLFLSSCCCLVLVWSEQRPGVILALIAKWLWQQVSCRAHESSSSWRCHTPPQFASQMQRQTRRPSGENEARYTAITSMSPWGALDVGALIAEESHHSVSSCQFSRKSLYAIYYAK